jgi:hypothetical protein
MRDSVVCVVGLLPSWRHASSCQHVATRVSGVRTQAAVPHACCLAPVVCAALTFVCVRTLVGLWSVLEATRLTVRLG